MTARCEIDLNVRARGHLTVCGFEDVTGDLPNIGQSVLATVDEDDCHLTAAAIVVDRDDDKRLLYLAVAWREFSTDEFDTSEQEIDRMITAGQPVEVSGPPISITINGQAAYWDRTVSAWVA